MKKMGVVICALLLSAVAHSATAVLEAQVTNGPGWLTKDVVVYTDGTVTATHLLSPSAGQSAPQVISTLSDSQMVAIQNSISSIQESPLVRTNPDQTYNPGGFVTSYILIHPDGQAFTFAKNVSGVDFGLSNSAGQDLIVILQGLLKLTSGK